MRRPYITVKFAQTLDGKIAAVNGSSKWISGLESRKFAHKLRAENDAILVGVNTILRDDPSLTARLVVKGRNPRRVIIDRRLRIPFTARVIEAGRSAKTIIFTSKKAPKTKIKRLREWGVEIINLPIKKGRNIDLREIIRILYKKGIKRILVEGGNRTITSFLKADLADRLIAIVSPKILGKGIESIGDLGIGNIKRALKLRLKSIKRLGEDIIYIAYV